MTQQKLHSDFAFRLANIDDLDQLVAVEQACFSGDRLSRRSLHRWIGVKHGILMVAIAQSKIVAYGLVWCHKGTRLARLYSLAVLPEMRGTGLAKALMQHLESAAAARGRLTMRLEVAKPNESAIALYRRCGYRIFGEYSDYYDDHSDALRMQKMIHPFKKAPTQPSIPWFQQTTEFTCGPAALIMALNSIDTSVGLSRSLELDIWREATTIFMTSGHGGCHPVGLALAARKRGFDAKVYVNTRETLFIDGVRTAHKKEILDLVHQQFIENAARDKVKIHYKDFKLTELLALLAEGYAVILLISTYRLDGKKSPHWVTVTGLDDDCIYVHDPHLEEQYQISMDCQYVPIARENLNKISSFGSKRLRTLVAIKPSSLG